MLAPLPLPTDPLRFTLPLKLAVYPFASLAVMLAANGTFVTFVPVIDPHCKLATAPACTAKLLLAPLMPPEVAVSTTVGSIAFTCTLPVHVPEVNAADDGEIAIAPACPAALSVAALA